MILLVLLVFAALPALAQSDREFTVLLGMNKRGIEQPTEDGPGFLDDEFNLDNSVVELGYGIGLDEDTFLKFKLGRIEAPVRYTTRVTRDAEGNITERFGADAPGEAQHVSALVEYRFSEAYGSTSIFGGLGLYRHTGEEPFATQTDYGFQAGISADFPVTRRYGVLLEAAHHWTRAEYTPKYLTIGVGLRASF